MCEKPELISYCFFLHPWIYIKIRSILERQICFLFSLKKRSKKRPKFNFYRQNSSAGNSYSLIVVETETLFLIKKKQMGSNK